MKEFTVLHRFENLCAWLLGSFLELIFSSKETPSAVQAVGNDADESGEQADKLRPYAWRNCRDWRFRRATYPDWREF